MTTCSLQQNPFDDFLHAMGAEPARTKRLSTMTSENRACFAKVIRSQLRGLATLPYGIGLDKHVYLELLQAIDIEPLTMMDERWQQRIHGSLRQRSEIFNELIDLRLAERNALVDLLVSHASESAPYAVQVAITVATACLNPSHLWKSLGLDSREELGTWLHHNFPTLAAANDQKMRWKRFFYLQLCKTGGDYVCRAPSCDACTSYAECFITE